MKIFSLIAFALSTVGTSLFAQAPAVQITTGNETGVAQVGSLPVKLGSVNLSNGNLSLSIPLVSLPGRGSSFSLALQYDSKIWQPHVSFSNTGQDAIIHWMYEMPGTQVGDFGWHLNLPFLSNPQIIQDDQGNMWGYGAEVITMPDGSKHSIAAVVPGMDSEDGDGYHMEYTVGSPNWFNGATDITVSSPDGVHVHFPYFGSTADKITDRNGNFISITATSITDSAGHQIALHQNSLGFYDRVDYPDATTSSTHSINLNISSTLTFPSATYSSTNPPFPHPAPANNVCYTSCYSYVYVTQPQLNRSYNLLTSVTLPDGTYSFEYNDYGEIKKVSYPGGGYARYDYTALLHGEVPWYVGGAVTTDFREVSYQYVCPQSSCTNETITHYEPVTGGGSFTNNSQNTVTVTENGTFSPIQKTLYTYDQPQVNENGYESPNQLSRISYDVDGSTPLSAATTSYTYLSYLNAIPQAASEFLCLNSSSAVSTTTTYTFDSMLLKVLRPIGLPYYQRTPTSDTVYLTSNPITKNKYDYVSRSNCGTSAPSSGSYGTLLRQDATSYKSADSHYSAASGANLVSLLVQQTVYDGSSNIAAQTTFEYDSGTPSTISGINQHGAAPGGSYRGNVTAVTKRVDSSNNVVSHTQYNEAGLATFVTDPKTNTTSFVYDSSYLYPTEVHAPSTNGIAHVDYYGYSPYTGQPLWHNDQNSTSSTDTTHRTSYSYDSMLRLNEVDFPDQGQITFTHNPNWTLKTTKTGTVSSPTYISNCVLFDGLGRQTQSQAIPGLASSCALNSAAAGTILTNTLYNGVDRVTDSSNPFTTGSAVYRHLTADGLGRTIVTAETDGNTTSTVYSLATVKTVDQAGVQWLRTSDAMGRLTQVQELGQTSSPLSLETDYVYDVLGNLKSVNQLGISGETARFRSFTYDSLSRLLTSSNPETGIICYGTVPSGQAPTTGNCTPGYDANSNLLAKTDARGITANYVYDALNRVTQKTYSDTTPAAYYTYDSFTGWGQPHGASIGRLVRSYTVGPSGTEDDLYSYDAMGRLNHIEGATPSEGGHGAHWTQMQYDLAGNLTKLLYPSGRIVSQGFDAAGRLNSVNYAAQASTWDINSGTAIITPYISSISYFPNGSPQTINYGNGVKEQLSQNNRLQTCESSALLAPALGGTMVFDRQYHFASSAGTLCGNESNNNGNIYSVVDGTNTSQGSGQRSQTFTYDPLNRIQTWNTNLMAGSPRSQTFNYDSFGNLTQSNGTNMPNFAPSAPFINNRLPASSFNCYASASNVGVDPSNPGYDLAGNVLCSDAQGYNAKAYIYDAESRISQFQHQVMNNTYVPAAAYSYDAQGNRIRKDQGSFGSSQFTEYVWANGQVLSEKDQSGLWTDYIYANGKKIARADSYDAYVHTKGTTTGGLGAAFNLPSLSYVVKANDRLFWRQMQQGGACAGPNLQFGNPVSVQTHQTWTDTTGQSVDNWTTQNQWVSRQANLNAYAGQTLTYVQFVTDSCTAAGSWDVYYADMAIVSPDGTVTPFYFRQTGGSFPNTWNEGQTNLSAVEETPVVNSSALSAPFTTTYYQADHLGTTQMEFSGDTPGWPVWKGEFSPFGQELDTQATSNHYKFTGKERDAESGLDYFGARYYGSNMGRMMSPDWSAKAEPVPYAKLDNPQSLNLYSYVLNNPLRYIDADGHYELNASNCGDNAKCQKKYDKAANKFEKQRAKNLNSKNESIRNAAANYGAKGEANGVHVGFGDTRSAGNNGGVDISGSSPGNTNINVTLDFSRAGNSETITHEGTHVGDDQKFLGSFDPRTGGYDQTLNPTHFQTEFNAFKAGAMVNHEHGFGPNDVQGITNYINTNYPARILPMPVFPVSLFPAGVPDE